MKKAQLIIACLSVTCSSYLYAAEDTLTSTQKDLQSLVFRNAESKLHVIAFFSEGRKVEHTYKLSTILRETNFFYSDSVEKIFKVFTDSLQIIQESGAGLLKRLKKTSHGTMLAYSLVHPSEPLTPSGRPVVIDPTPDTLSNKGTSKILLLYFLGGAVLGITLMFFLAKFFTRKSSSENKSDSILKETITILKEGFVFDKKNGDIKELAKAAVAIHANDAKNHLAEISDLKNTNKKYSATLTKMETEKEEFESQIVNKDNKIDLLSKEINELTEKLKTEESNMAEQKIISHSILEKFYYPLKEAIDNDNKINNEELVSHTLMRLLQIAFHSISGYRLFTKAASDDDNQNLSILKNKVVHTERFADINTPRTNMDRLVYLVLLILNKHGLDKLDDVLIRGYKIGR